MNVRFKASFAADVQALRDKTLLERVRGLIAQVESAESLAEIPNLKRLRGGGSYYRARLGDYRIGLAVDESVVVFVRVLHRREVYRYFP